MTLVYRSLYSVDSRELTVMYMYVVYYVQYMYIFPLIRSHVFIVSLVSTVPVAQRTLKASLTFITKQAPILPILPLTSPSLSAIPLTTTRSTKPWRECVGGAVHTFIPTCTCSVRNYSLLSVVDRTFH